MKLPHRQSGLSLVEFTFVATALLIVIFGIFEIGRYVYSVQVVNEITRKAVRLGVVCHVEDRNDIPALAITSNAPPGFTAANIVIEYLDQSGEVVTIPSEVGSDAYEAAYTKIKFVRARVTGYQYQILSFMSVLTADGWAHVPDVQITLPAESLGVIRPTDANPNPPSTDC